MGNVVGYYQSRESHAPGGLESPGRGPPLPGWPVPPEFEFGLGLELPVVALEVASPLAFPLPLVLDKALLLELPEPPALAPLTALDNMSQNPENPEPPRLGSPLLPELLLSLLLLVVLELLFAPGGGTGP